MTCFGQATAVDKALQSYEISGVERVARAGGTASPKYVVEAGGSRYMLRLRPEQFADQRLIAFDHRALQQLKAAKLPVPIPVSTSSGQTWTRVGSAVYELLTWVDGASFVWEDTRSLVHLGNSLARFHQALQGKVPPGKEGWRREDHPGEMRQLCASIARLARTKSEREALAGVAEQIDLVDRELDSRLYTSLPQRVIHGDLHPGNVGFDRSRVSAIYDFDYLSVQSRMRDVADAIMFFAASREDPLNHDDVYSLTQPFQPDWARTKLMLQSYHSFEPLTSAEWDAASLLMRSRWIQIRLRGSRKVPVHEKVDFVLDRFFQSIRWLDTEAGDFFESLQNKPDLSR
jgi:Ser/Thr protein kinase RdoA (MazF antagonist)